MRQVALAAIDEYLDRPPAATQRRTAVPAAEAVTAFADLRRPSTAAAFARTKSNTATLTCLTP